MSVNGVMFVCDWAPTAEDADVPVTEQGAGNADANADGELSVLDVTSVLRTILGAV